MLISDAYADPSPSAPTASAPTPATATTGYVPTGSAGPAEIASPSPFSGLGVLIFFVAIMYLFMIRPNQKRVKDYEAMVKALRRGDRVVTGGGIIGVISKIENDEVLVVEIAPDVKVRVMRDTISNIVNKTAVNDNKAEDKKKSDDLATGK